MAILVNKQSKQKIETDSPSDIVRLKAGGFVEASPQAKPAEQKQPGK